MERFKNEFLIKLTVISTFYFDQPCKFNRAQKEEQFQIHFIHEIYIIWVRTFVKRKFCIKNKKMELFNYFLRAPWSVKGLKDVKSVICNDYLKLRLQSFTQIIVH